MFVVLGWRNSPDRRREPVDERKRLAPISPDIALRMYLEEPQVPERCGQQRKFRVSLLLSFV
jgi:hypothetical protein